ADIRNGKVRLVDVDRARDEEDGGAARFFCPLVGDLTEAVIVAPVLRNSVGTNLLTEGYEGLAENVVVEHLQLADVPHALLLSVPCQHPVSHCRHPAVHAGRRIETAEVIAADVGRLRRCSRDPFRSVVRIEESRLVAVDVTVTAVTALVTNGILD